MRRLIVIVVAAALLWSGWWALGARATAAAFEGWLAAQREAGRVAEAAVRVRGYPFRFDTTFEDLAIGEPGGWLWSAERFQTLMLSYAPNRAVAAWPGPQRIGTPLGEVVAEAAEATASVRVGASAALPLERIALVARGVSARGAGWTASVAEARAAAEREGGEAEYHLGLYLADVALPPGVELAGLLPVAVELLRVDASARLSAPVGRASAAAPPELEAFEIAEARLDWGDARVTVSGGPVEIGRDGAPYGALRVVVEDWPLLVEAAVAAGLLAERHEPLTVAALRLLAEDGSERATIDTVLAFENGRMRIGPVPLGRAPRLQRQ